MDIRKIATGLLPPLAVALLFAGWMGVKDRLGEMLPQAPPMAPEKEFDDSAGPAPVIAPPDAANPGEQPLDAQGIIEILEPVRDGLSEMLPPLWESKDPKLRDDALGIQLSMIVIEGWLRDMRSYIAENPEAAERPRDKTLALGQMKMIVEAFLSGGEEEARKARKTVASGERDEPSIALLGCREILSIFLYELNKGLGQ